MRVYTQTRGRISTANQGVTNMIAARAPKARNEVRINIPIWKVATGAERGMEVVVKW